MYLEEVHSEFHQIGGKTFWETRTVPLKGSATEAA